MKLDIKGRLVDLGSGDEALDKLQAEIDRESNQGTYAVRRVLVDGTEIYGDYMQQIRESKSAIGTVTIEMATQSEMRREMIEDALAYLNRAIPVLEPLSERFVQGPDSEAWSLLGHMVEGMQWISGMLALTQFNQADRFREGVSQAIGNLQGAIQIQDYTSISDIIHFEILPVYEEIRDHLIQSAEAEGSQHALQ
ncbi:hypothetical protein ACFQWB_16175 [Paenibacillus thermoaerophilus]|uniref:DUF8042 domain-containing protein n=1 Tax=Paenibacillus thermoaerophilus TaxID=1215385 RepID=A0ABW2V887_9BACL|nr:hypothetical protein [Paenibacillus thermoaerophilus]TMV09227.1 hypothetical protein FE781_14935 [Paenibacillus thermoaerophilus]